MDECKCEDNWALYNDMGVAKCSHCQGECFGERAIKYYRANNMIIPMPHVDKAIDEQNFSEEKKQAYKDYFRTLV